MENTSQILPLHIFEKLTTEPVVTGPPFNRGRGASGGPREPLGWSGITVYGFTAGGGLLSEGPEFLAPSLPTETKTP